MAKPSVFSVQPREAIEFMRRKVRVPTAMWNDLWQDAHSAAFMVAGAQKASLIEDFHEAVTAALENGSTLEMFRKDFDRIVARHGWNYNGSRNWRSNIIFRTNMSMARSAGRWAQIQQTKKHRPYIRYSAVQDGRTRPEHKAWHNLVLPVDHPFWETHYPPNDWLCRCQAGSLSERDLKRLKLEVSEDPEIVWENREMNTSAGKVRVKVPEGVGTGFSYNPGLAGFGRGPGSLAAEKHGPFEALRMPGRLHLEQLGPLDPVTPRTPILRAANSDDEIREALRGVLGGEEQVYIDPTGAPVRVTQAVAQHIIDKNDQRMQRERFFSLIPEIIEEPAEIWIGFAKSSVSGRVLLRRRYIKMIRIDKNRIIALIADADHNEWAAMTFYQGRMSGLNNLRSGLRIWQMISEN